MKQKKLTTKQEIARLNSVYFQSWVMLKRMDAEMKVIQDKLKIVYGEEEGSNEEE